MDPRKDLETMLGDPKKAIRSMAVPLIFSYLIVQVNIFADTSWCSGLGADASSAVSSISPVYWIVSGLGTGIGFLLAAYLLYTATERLNSPLVPDSFRGFPIMLVYVGILSLALYAFTGYTTSAF